MAKIRIHDSDRALIDALRRKQDQNAHALGVAVAEYETRREELLRTALGAPDYRLRVGALVTEHEGHRLFFMDAIRRCRAEQAAAGTQALLRVGVDPAKGEYTIIGDLVLRLIGGVWWEEWDDEGRGTVRSDHGSLTVGA